MTNHILCDSRRGSPVRLVTLMTVINYYVLTYHLTCIK